MMRIYFLVLIILTFLFSRCSNRVTNRDEYSLRTTKHFVSLPVPKDIKNVSKSLQYYISNKNQFLFYLGEDSENEILIYNLDSMKIYNKIQMMKEGPSGVGNIFSLFVHNLDTVFLTTGRMDKLFMTNWKGELNKTILIHKFYNGGFEEPYNFISHVLYFQNSMIYHNEKIYAGVHIPFLSVEPEKLKLFKTTMEIDLNNGRQTLLPMCFPKIMDKKGKPLYLYLSSLYIKNKFIYSFINSHDCLITKDHINIETKTVRSRYANKDFKMPEFPSVNMMDMSRTILEHPSYLNFIYDPYRDLIYRFCYPGITLSNTDNLVNMSEFKPIFSVMILDTDLNILGETLMPKNTYNLNMSFVGKDGLYLSTNHYLNKGFNADSLKFEIFNVVMNEIK